MKRKYTILHISDLHKPKNCNLDNLFYSLQTDCEGYVKEGMPKPEIIVISGDLAEGTKDCGDNAENIIRREYAEVKKFLEKLTDYFLDGQKRRMVIVPGNHDYCYKVSKNSMELSPAENAKDDCNKMKIAEPEVRWDWDERRFYHVTNDALYNTRFELYREFYNDFFAGIRDVVGGRSASYEQVLREAKDTSMNEMMERALAIGANAIVGIDIDYETIGSSGSMLMVATSGTAVVL